LGERLSQVVSEPDRGIYDAMNKGVALATGDVLYFLNADDVFIHERVLEQVATAVVESDCDVFFGDLLILNAQTGKAYFKRYPQVDRGHLILDSITQQAVFYRRPVFDTVGLFNADLRIVGDHDWILRALLQHQLKAGYLSQPVAVFSLGGISNHRDYRELHHQERQQLLSQYFPNERISVRRLVRLKKHLKKPLLRRVSAALLNWRLPNVTALVPTSAQP
jgi:glycosyltransferase